MGALKKRKKICPVCPLVKTALLFVDQSGWAVLSRASVNHSRYTLIDTAMTFYAGQERCQRLGGHLVHINTIREQLFVEDFIRQMLQTTHQQGTYGTAAFRTVTARSLGSYIILPIVFQCVLFNSSTFYPRDAIKGKGVPYPMRSVGGVLSPQWINH